MSGRCSWRGGTARARVRPRHRQPPGRPPVAGLDAAGYLTNNDLFDLPEPPKSLFVLGGGPIGVEMAQAFQRLGTRVILAQRAPRLLPRDDAELAGELTSILRAEGVNVRLNTGRRAGGGRRRRVLLRDRGGAEEEVAVRSWWRSDGGRTSRGSTWLPRACAARRVACAWTPGCTRPARASGPSGT